MRPGLVKRITLLLMSAAMAIIFLYPEQSYAQKSVSELEANVNASGRTHLNMGARISGEIGMGLLGAVSALVGGGVIFLATMSFGGIAGGILGYELTVTPLVAGGTYLGGWLAGGRGKAGPVFGGAYIGSIPGYVLFVLGITVGTRDALLIASAIATPLLSLLGAIVGYELSEKAQTRRLQDEKNALTAGSTGKLSSPFMINLLSGTF